VEVCLRSEETDFQVDHFRAVCRFAEEGRAWKIEDGNSASRILPSSILHPPSSSVAALDPQSDLYGRLLFHTGRFQRLRGYQLLKAKECVAEIEADGGAPWFAPYLPAEFVLGNPAARDAALHAIQACIPHRRILPTGMGRAVILRNESGPHFVHAKERSRDGNNFVYDVEITDARGELIERWEGLRLRAVEMLPTREAWPEALLAPYLERRLEELAAAPDVAPVKIVLERRRSGERPATTDAAIQQALGDTTRIWRRPDGKPVLSGGENVSAAHAGEFTMAATSANDVACDLAEVSAQTEAAWRDLLGRERFQLAGRISREMAENQDTAATRLWAAMECLKKIGQPANAPLVVESCTDDGWTLLRSGAIIIATCVVAMRENKLPLVAAVALKPRGELQPAATQIPARPQARI
jgi:enediyne polyketide synthase